MTADRITTAVELASAVAIVTGILILAGLGASLIGAGVLGIIFSLRAST